MSDVARMDSQKPLILIIEDDTLVRDSLGELVRLAGYEFRTASSCDEGRQVFVPGSFACTLIDLGLPDGSGLELLRDFTKADPCLVTVVLTGEVSPDTIIKTMRAGAFDYLTKPVNITLVRASISRALAHHAVMRERAELVLLLLEEREQLRARVEAATSDLRQYAQAVEISNTRLRSLLGLSRLSANFYSAENLGRSVFDEITRHVPVSCLAMCDISRRKLLAIYRGHQDGAIQVYRESDIGDPGYDSIIAEAQPNELIRDWVERGSEIDVKGLNLLVFPQKFWNRYVCSVGYYIAADYVVDDTDQEFLGTCASFFAFEWEQAHLMLQVAHHASLGNIAVELARNFIQPLTAIQTASDIVQETVEALESADCVEGVRVIRENVDRLRRQTQEFRKLSMLREDSVETVKLDEYVRQALDILSVAIQNRNVSVHTQFATDCECVLLNGTVLARTVLDLILSAVRAVDVGGSISLGIRDAGKDYVILEISHEGHANGLMSKDKDFSQRMFDDIPITEHPGLQLAERTVHSCGGKFSIDLDEKKRSRMRVLLPRNATSPSVILEPAW